MILLEYGKLSQKKSFCGKNYVNIFLAKKY